jgi:uncharacterized protein YceK
MKIHIIQVCLLAMVCSMLSGCSSMMTHSGNDEPYYPGTIANNATIGNKENSWSVRALAIMDYPFSLILDTVLFPWDYFHHSESGQKSLREKVADAEKQSHKPAP